MDKVILGNTNLGKGMLYQILAETALAYIFAYAYNPSQTDLPALEGRVLETTGVEH